MEAYVVFYEFEDYDDEGHILKIFLNEEKAHDYAQKLNFAAKEITRNCHIYSSPCDVWENEMSKIFNFGFRVAPPNIYGDGFNAYVYKYFIEK